MTNKPEITGAIQEAIEALEDVVRQITNLSVGGIEAKKAAYRSITKLQTVMDRAKDIDDIEDLLFARVERDELLQQITKKGE